MEITPPAQYLPLDARLVITDMDGTLLDGCGKVPERLWPILATMRERGAFFVPASGRQYQTLATLFAREADGMPFIAENGTYVVRDGVEISSSTLDPEFVAGVIQRIRGLVDDGHDLGLVLAGKRAAYVERPDRPFVDEVSIYYHSHEVVDDLLSVEDDVLKIAIYDFDDAELGTFPYVQDFASTHSVVVSGHHWIDIMNTGVNKGQAVKALQDSLGITPEQTVAFGDYLNDLEMLQASGVSFATANAHPDIVNAARYVAPANTDEGVIEVLQNIFG